MGCGNMAPGSMGSMSPTMGPNAVPGGGGGRSRSRSPKPKS